MNSPEKPSSSPVEDSQEQSDAQNFESSSPSLTNASPELFSAMKLALCSADSCKSLEKELPNAHFLSQIRMLSSLHDAAMTDLLIPEPRPVGTYYNAQILLHHIQHENDVCPLAKIIAEHYGKNLSTTMMTIYGGGEKSKEGIESRQRSIKLQLAIDSFAESRSFPSDNYKIVASDAIMVTDRATGEVEFISNDGKHESNSIKISSENAELIRLMHNKEITTLINDRLGLNLNDISLRSQVQLLRFMTAKLEDRFNSICSALKNTDEKNRLKLAEAFFAVGFGADFGDSLIDIANSKNFSPDQLGNILNNINSCRKSIHNITELYKDFDNGDFARQYSRAANERLTDVLAVFRRVANSSDRKPIQLGWAGNFYPDYRNANEALEYETKSLEIVSGTLGDVQNHEKGAYAEVVIAPEEGNARTVYNFYSPNHGYVLAYTRPLAAERFDASFEYGKEDVGVEASMSLITNPKDPFTILDPFRPKPYIVKDRDRYDPKRMDKISAIRIDREGRFLKEAPNSPYKSPIRRQGTVSVDLAAINDRSDTPSGKIARLISAGNALRAMDRKTQTTLNHNTNYFDQAKYGTESGFEQLVNYIDSVFTKWCNDTPPKSNEGYVGLLKTAARKRGRKALGEVS